MEWNVQINAKNQRVKLPDQIADNSVFEVEVNGRTVEAKWQRSTKTLFILDKQRSQAWMPIHSRTFSSQRFPGESDIATYAEFTPSGSKQTLSMDATLSPVVPGQEGRAAAANQKPKIIRSQITGKVLKIFCKAGNHVTAGDTLLVIEAMKMENRIVATFTGVIDTLKVSEGETVSSGKELIRFK